MNTLLGFLGKYKIVISFTTLIGFIIGITGFVINEVVVYKKQTIIYEATLSDLKREIASTSGALNRMTRMFIKTEIGKIDQELRLIQSPITDPRAKEYTLRTRKILLEAELEKIK